MMKFTIFFVSISNFFFVSISKNMKFKNLKIKNTQFILFLFLVSYLVLRKNLKRA